MEQLHLAGSDEGRTAERPDGSGGDTANERGALRTGGYLWQPDVWRPNGLAPLGRLLGRAATVGHGGGDDADVVRARANGSRGTGTKAYRPTSGPREAGKWKTRWTAELVTPQTDGAYRGSRLGGRSGSSASAGASSNSLPSRDSLASRRGRALDARRPRTAGAGSHTSSCHSPNRYGTLQPAGRTRPRSSAGTRALTEPVNEQHSEVQSLSMSSSAELLLAQRPVTASRAQNLSSKMLARALEPEPEPEPWSGPMAFDAETMAEMLFQEIDADGGGTLEPDEVAALAKQLGCPLSQEELDAAMATMDADGNGHVDFDEFLPWYKQLAEEDSQADGNKGKKGSGSAAKWAQMMRLRAEYYFECIAGREDRVAALSRQMDAHEAATVQEEEAEAEAARQAAASVAAQAEAAAKAEAERQVKQELRAKSRSHDGTGGGALQRPPRQQPAMGPTGYTVENRLAGGVNSAALPMRRPASAVRMHAAGHYRLARVPARSWAKAAGWRR